MVTFETLKSEEIKFGKNNFLEIARKRAIADDGENEFISLSRGFMTESGERRYRKSFAIPLNDEVVDFVVENLKKM